MDRGLKRCSGVPETFSSEANDLQAFFGEQAHGEWLFSIRDADSNDHSGALIAAALSLSVRNGDETLTSTVSLAHLPADIPN
jgi:hypothetical protein